MKMVLSQNAPNIVFYAWNMKMEFAYIIYKYGCVKHIITFFFQNIIIMGVY